MRSLLIALFLVLACCVQADAQCAGGSCGISSSMRYGFPQYYQSIPSYQDSAFTYEPYGYSSIAAYQAPQLYRPYYPQYQATVLPYSGTPTRTVIYGSYWRPRFR